MPFKHDPNFFSTESVAKYLWNAHDALDKQINYFKTCVNNTRKEWETANEQGREVEYPTEVVNKTIDMLQDEADRLIRIRNLINQYEVL